MKKKFLSLFVILTLLFAMAVNVQAEDFTGGDGWNVVFNGREMTSTFKNADIDDAIYQLQPGDTVTIHLSLQNTYDGDTNWYMTNEVLQSLEDSQSVAEGGAYSYILTYIKPDGTSELLYSSEAVGGESSNESGEGLHQATDSLEDYFYLGSLSSGQSGEITLVVHLEGETQGNAYQDTLAKLQMNFAVELATSVPPANSRNTSTTSTINRVVKTGDYSNIYLFCILTLVAGLVCVGIVIYRIRQNKRNHRKGGK